MSDRVVAALRRLVGKNVPRQEIDRGGRMLRWFEAGDGPAVVFEAGAMSPVAGFAAVFKELAADHRVIAYDRAGYGASDPVELDLELQVSDLLAVLENAGSAVVVGHSWGGLLAQLAGWARPELIRGLVLVDPSHEAFWSDVPAPLRQRPTRTDPVHDNPRSADLLESARELAADTARSVGGDPQLEDACLSYLETDAQLFTYLDELPMILEHLHQIAVLRSQSVWPQVPVVLFTATKGRPEDLTPQVIALQDEVVAAAKGKHVIVPDAGHYIHLDRPDLVVQAVQEISGRSAAF